MQSIFRWFTIVKRRRPRRKASAKVKTDYKKHKEQARALVLQKLQYWNQFYNFSYRKVAIRAQKSRWGSCSSKGNLNFNYRIISLSEELCDYLIVHELCHLAQMNHGKEFWKLVEQTIPNYRKLRHVLRVENPIVK